VTLHTQRGSYFAAKKQRQVCSWRPSADIKGQGRSSVVILTLYALAGSYRQEHMVEAVESMLESVLIYSISTFT
jgi:hypothetical protein